MKELLTLDRAWFLCLQQWKDGIIKRLDEGSGSSVMILKNEWIDKLIEQNDCDEEKIESDCFFCEYNLRQEDDDDKNIICRSCPGKLVDDEFHCENIEYHYYDKPRKFYVKLLKLNSKRITNGTRLGTGEQNER